MSQDPLPGQQLRTASSRRLGRRCAGTSHRAGRQDGSRAACATSRSPSCNFYRIHVCFHPHHSGPKRPDRDALVSASEVTIAMSDQFPVFEVVLKRRGRTWSWRVCTTEGDVVMLGSESSRAAAKYKADRALFLLLMSAPYRSKGRCWWQSSPSGGGRIAPASAPKCIR